MKELTQATSIFLQQEITARARRCQEEPREKEQLQGPRSQINTENLSSGRYERLQVLKANKLNTKRWSGTRKWLLTNRAEGMICCTEH